MISRPQVIDDSLDALKKRAENWSYDVIAGENMPVWRSDRDDRFLLLDDARLQRLHPEADVEIARTLTKKTNEGRGLYEAFTYLEAQLVSHYPEEEEEDEVVVLSTSKVADGHAPAAAVALIPSLFDYGTIHATARTSKSAVRLFEMAYIWRAAVPKPNLNFYPPRLNFFVRIVASCVRS